MPFCQPTPKDRSLDFAFERKLLIQFR